MERFIIDDQGRRTAVILDIEDYKALLRAAEDAEDIQAVYEALKEIDSGEDEMIDYREAHKGWQSVHSPDKSDEER